MFEREPEFGEVGAGIQLGPNVFKMFERLGLTKAVLDTAVLPEALVMMDGLTGEPITRIPVNDASFRSRFSYPYAVTYRPDLHAALLAACFRGQHANVLAMLERIESWRMWVLCDREPIKSWSSGRVTLLGDAAHPTLQYLAQGACMAIEDAVCLASKVAVHGDDLAAAFVAYQSARYLRTARVQLTARFYGDVYHAAGVTAELRDLALKNRTPEQGYEGVAWLYGGIDDDGCQQL